MHTTVLRRRGQLLCTLLLWAGLVLPPLYSIQVVIVPQQVIDEAEQVILDLCAQDSRGEPAKDSVELSFPYFE